MALKPKVGLGQEFLSNLSKIPPAVQNKILKWAVRFQADPTASGMNYETIKGARDKNLKSVRIDQDWRGIIFKPASGDLYVLMYVDHHDAAYRWAEGRKVAVNPTTGALQLFAVEPIIEPAIKQVREESTARQAAFAKPLFANLSNDELTSLGVPQELLNVARSIRSEAELDAAQPHLPVEAYEGLFLVMAGDTVSQVLASRETRVDRSIDTKNFLAAIETPEAQSRFVVVADEETMAAMLNSPLAQWRVFLHPTQRKLAQSDRNGPVRVLGGAGTGKTVLAMHRAKWLTEQRSATDKKVLFTTFTRNLAADIEENLKTLCSPGVMQKIEVRNLDAWVHGFLRRHKYEHRIIYDRNKGEAAAAWRQALTMQDSSIALPENFYQEELERVVLAQGVATKDEYRQAKRAGRGVVLTRAKRDAIWPVFEEYRAQLASRKLKEVADAYRDAAALMREEPKPYSSIVIDETQDFGQQALRLLRAMVPEGPNDLFFVGDGHQRIYPRHRASMSVSGIDIRGRSRKLYLNYRTTEEIRKFAVAILQGCQVDDLDEGADEVKRYKSLSHGALPEILKVSHREDALHRLPSVIRGAVKDGRYTCVIVPRNSDAKDVEVTLKGAGLVTAVLGPDQRDQPESKAVRIATMHRAKGLEFDEIVLLLPADLASLGPLAENIQQLQYVALTRAKQAAFVIRYGGHLGPAS
jgi:superfamily I DNA/RNA helicase